MKEERCEVQVGLYAIWQRPSVYLFVFFVRLLSETCTQNAVFLQN